MDRRFVGRGALALALLVLVVAVIARKLIRDQAGPPVRAAMAIDQTLGGADTAGFARAIEQRSFAFPEDHGPHPEFRNEWWYLTGNLVSANGRRFGYQLTFFRSAISASMPSRDSEWAARHVWMAHFALTDVQANRFHSFEKFARDALDLAGSTASPFHVWIEDWSLATAPARAGTDTPDSVGAGNTADLTPGSIFPLKVHASRGDVSIELVLDAGKPVVLNGDAGLSRKGAEPGNASYYYAFTRLPTTGTISVAGNSHTVTGSTWFDREWSTSALSEGVAGWDWFAIQLADSSELMVYRLRRQDGSTDSFSAGTFVARDGSTTSLKANDFEVDATDSWRGTIDGTQYPARWTVRVPSLVLSLDVQPVVANQELDLSFRYWEGAVTARGSRDGQAVTGHGYVELTGYSNTNGKSPGSIARR